MSSSLGFSDVSVERKLEGSPGGYDRGASGARVDMVELLLELDAYEVALTAAAARNYAIRSRVRCSVASVEEI